MTPFGTGIPGARKALNDAVPSVENLSNAEVERYLNIILNALNGKIADRNRPPTSSKARTDADFAHFTLIEQGLRLLVIERIMKTRNLPIPPPMSDWLRTVKMSVPIHAELRDIKPARLPSF